jgi:hypothetical protein
MSGAVLSKTNTFRLATPNIVVAQGDYALLRDGHTLQVMAADDFDEIYPDLEGQDFKLLVRKWPNPYPHLRLHGYELNGEKVDTRWVLGESELPLVVDHRLYDTSLYETVETAGWESGTPRNLVDEKIWVKATIESEPIEVEADGEEPAGETEEEAAPVEVDESDEELADTLMIATGGGMGIEEGPSDRYFLTIGGRRFELITVNEDGVEVLLKGHEAAGNLFGVGGYISELFPRRQAAATGLDGMFQLEVFDFGDKFVLLR